MKSTIKLLLLFTVLSFTKMNAQKEEFFQPWKIEFYFVNGKDKTGSGYEKGSILTFNKDKSFIYEIENEKIKGKFIFDEDTKSITLTKKIDSETGIFKIIFLSPTEMKLENYEDFDKTEIIFKSVKPQK